MKTIEVISVISDTHGLLRPEALGALEGAEYIIHAGDIGTPDVLETLRSIAPVSAIRGNTDRGNWARKLPETEAVEISGVSIYIIHDVNDLDVSPGRAGFDVVISGHSHRPALEKKDGVIFLNPGSAGPRRFDLPVSIARIRIGDDGIYPEIVELKTR